MEPKPWDWPYQQQQLVNWCSCKRGRCCLNLSILIISESSDSAYFVIQTLVCMLSLKTKNKTNQNNLFLFITQWVKRTELTALRRMRQSTQLNKMINECVIMEPVVPGRLLGVCAEELWDSHREWQAGRHAAKSPTLQRPIDSSVQ